MSTRIRQARRQRGIALVETAICLPVLLFVMLAAGEITNVFIQHNTLTKAVRDGSRHAAGNAINHGAKVFDLNAGLVNETRNLVVFGNTAGSGTPVLPNLTVGAVTVLDAGGEIVEVRASYGYTGIIGAVLPAFGFGADHSLDFNLQASVRMRAL
jgi:Flp pilus assembly protein TadG